MNETEEMPFRTTGSGMGASNHRIRVNGTILASLGHLGGPPSDNKEHFGLTVNQCFM